MYSGQDGNNVVGPGGVGAGSGAPISSGQGMMPNWPIASGGGDIVLNNSGDQKSKKGLKWAIGIIVGVLILIGVGVGVWWGMKDSGQRTEEVGLTDRQQELLKLFEVSEGLSKYNDESLMQIYTEGDFKGMKKEIASKLAELNLGVIGYVDSYVEKMNNFSNIVDEAAGLFYENGCVAKTIEELDDCTFTEDVGRAIDEKNMEMKITQRDIEYIVKAAKRFYNNGGK
ncbi:hypothetical protein IKF02_00255 [Candidatus Saccharibacteria bacterium]|nr:hypothetical protein [Candidatus Saccharibacteria bacterium]MBR3144258.1 hypothetical protein [Candidatus Saccharibacteria bacterium]